MRKHVPMTQEIAAPGLLNQGFVQSGPSTTPAVGQRVVPNKITVECKARLHEHSASAVVLLQNQ